MARHVPLLGGARHGMLLAFPESTRVRKSAHRLWYDPTIHWGISGGSTHGTLQVLPPLVIRRGRPSRPNGNKSG